MAFPIDGPAIVIPSFKLLEIVFWLAKIVPPIVLKLEFSMEIPTEFPMLTNPDALSPMKLPKTTFEFEDIWSEIPAPVFPETRFRSAAETPPIVLLLPPITLMPTPLGDDTVPAFVNPMKLPAMVLLELPTKTPDVPNFWIPRPRIELPLLPLPNVSPLALSPALVPSSPIKIVALLDVVLVFADAPDCEYPLMITGLVKTGSAPSPDDPTMMIDQVADPPPPPPTPMPTPIPPPSSPPPLVGIAKLIVSRPDVLFAAMIASRRLTCPSGPLLNASQLIL
jgi:hypothetical protein